MPASDSSAAIEALEPQAVWRFFKGMSAVPRPSKKEQRIRAHLRELAGKRGFEVREDDTGNMVIDVPATAGCEHAPITVIQGHVDMVCEQNRGTNHDFDNDGIKLILTKDAKGRSVVTADGTTLGADNGVGVCLGLAAATEQDVVHGPLELLLTVDEEQGMTGAKALAADFVKGRRLINLDSEEDDVLYIGCAGGCDVNLNWTFPCSAVTAEDSAYAVEVSGLRGGHSGGDIHENRANANKLLVQTLLGADIECQIADIEGGRLRNAIPREARATVVCSKDAAQRLQESAATVQRIAATDHKDRDCQITVTPAAAEKALSTADSGRLLRAIAALPHGVLAVVPEIPGLVQTSNNVATITTASGKDTLQVHVGCLARSSSGDQLAGAVRQISAVGGLSGATTETGNQYPGWQPDVDSPLLSTTRRTYQKLFEESPKVTAIHAGLECGLLGERLPGMDMISFGPSIVGAHSPDEQVDVQSVGKIWKLLKSVLSELTKG